MNPLGTKALVGVGIAGILGGAGYGIHVLTDTTDTVSNYFKKDNSIEVISQDDSLNTLWTKAYDAYLLEKDENGLSIKDKTISNGTSIKDWCREALTKSVKSTSDLLYRQAKKWCTKFNTISEQIGTSKQKETELSALNAKYDSLPPKIKNELQQISDTDNSHPNGAKLKKWCENNLKRRYLNDKEFYFENIQNNCFKQVG